MPIKFEYWGGKLRRVTCENALGLPMPDETTIVGDHLMIQEMEYDKYGNLTAIKSLDKNGNVIKIYDQRPDLNYCRVNITKVYNPYYDEEGKLYDSPGWGYAVMKIEHNAWEHYVDEYKFAASGEPFVFETGVFKTRTYINQNNDTVATEFYDVDGNKIELECEYEEDDFSTSFDDDDIPFDGGDDSEYDDPFSDEPTPFDDD